MSIELFGIKIAKRFRIINSGETIPFQVKIQRLLSRSPQGIMKFIAGTSQNVKRHYFKILPLFLLWKTP